MRRHHAILSVALALGLGMAAEGAGQDDITCS